MKYPYQNNKGKFAPALVEYTPPDAVYLSDSQDVEAVKEYMGEKAKEYDSFFVLVGEGEYLAVWGMYGIVPYLDRVVYRIY